MVLLIAKRNGMSDEEIASLGDLGFEIRLLDRDGEVYDGNTEDIEAVICFQFFKHNDIRRFPKLKLIHLTSAGYDHMPLDYLREKGIALYNARGVYSVPIAEYVLGGVLHLYKEFPYFTAQNAEGGWAQLGNLRELSGKAVTIVGAGSIAAEISRRFVAMGCSVTALSRNPKADEVFSHVGNISSLGEILPETDILILAAPLNEGTFHIMNGGTFALMKKGSVFVNIARGGLADTDALMAALNSGHISGAVLDVFEEEPLPAEHPIRKMKNVLITPHNSFAGEFNGHRSYQVMHKDLKDYLEGK